VRRTINLRTVKHGHDELWSFVMLPYGLLVSGFPPHPFFLFIREASA
jgi:hypothetical protein